jgi:hypothetical protein
VIVVRQEAAVELALFGFSGRATNAIGDELVADAEKFWSTDDFVPGAKINSPRPERADLFSEIKPFPPSYR